MNDNGNSIQTSIFGKVSFKCKKDAQLFETEYPVIRFSTTVHESHGFPDIKENPLYEQPAMPLMKLLQLIGQAL